ncbi:MAG: chemotaxis protein CheB [Balneolales bacterium]
MTEPEYVVAIGASAGGLDSLAELVKNLETKGKVAYCIVLHLSNKGIGEHVLFRLRKVTSIPCSLANDGQVLESDHIYVARPNHHLLVKEGKMLLGHGPQENRWKPSIDVLLRSAAVAYRSRTIGIILSGRLNDGTSGMWAIKRSGGVCIIQDPDQAEYPDMPKSVMNQMDVDYVAKLSEMGRLISDIADREKVEDISVPEEVIRESTIAEQMATGIDAVSQLKSETSVLACPDCGGSLWKVNADGNNNRYRCHIGHAYTEEDLVFRQAYGIESTLWVALRMMEERKHLLSNMEVDNKKRGYTTMVSSYNEKQKEMNRHIDQLKEMLTKLDKEGVKT